MKQIIPSQFSILSLKRKLELTILCCIITAFISCSNRKEQADLIVHNAVVYTVDSAFSTASAFVIKEGKFLEIGSDELILKKYAAADTINANGKAVYPGLIDAHCHFYSYGRSLQRANLVETKSFDEVLQRVVEFSKTKPSEWILGRGWDQNDWDVKSFPDNKKLDSLFPNTPVVLTRIDGHAALANSEALKRANIDAKTKINGGLVEVKNGKPTGILVDNAVDLMSKVVPAPDRKKIIRSLLDAQQNCFAVGLTTVDDAGLSKDFVYLIDSLHKTGDLKMRVYQMLSDNKENLEHFLANGPMKTDRLNVRSFKCYADGALGSRGACLLKPYSDMPTNTGFLLDSVNHFQQIAQQLYEKGFQMNTHCIGDSADRFILNTYASVLKGKNDKRWRIEHAQVVNKNDFKLFGDNSIIPSVQSTHATSDMYWAKDRLGEERVKGAYAYKQLLNTVGVISLGTDFPVENINPMYTFYASVARKDLKGFPAEGFQMENALTREETLKGMTIWAAYSNFEENEKGSIESGKFADFVMLDNDIMQIEIDKVPTTKVLLTVINGEKVFERK